MDQISLADCLLPSAIQKFLPIAYLEFFSVSFWEIWMLSFAYFGISWHLLFTFVIMIIAVCLLDCLSTMSLAWITTRIYIFKTFSHLILFLYSLHYIGSNYLWDKMFYIPKGFVSLFIIWNLILSSFPEFSHKFGVHSAIVYCKFYHVFIILRTEIQ